MTTYEKVVALAKPFLGPATENFIARQCKAHLQIDPLGLTHLELPQLATWLEISGALVMSASKAKELASRVGGIRP